MKIVYEESVDSNACECIAILVDKQCKVMSEINMFSQYITAVSSLVSLANYNVIIHTDIQLDTIIPWIVNLPFRLSHGGMIDP